MDILSLLFFGTESSGDTNFICSVAAIPMTFEVM